MIRHTLILLLTLAASLGVGAQTFTADGINYEVITGQTAAVKVITSSTPYVGNIHIPETVQKDNATYTVTTIADGAFSDCPQLLSITLPGSVTTIEKTAIRRCENLYSLSFGEGLETLNSANLTGCPHLCHINYWGDSQNVLYTMQNLIYFMSPTPTIHCNLEQGSDYNVLPFNHVRLSQSETYGKEAYGSFVTYLPLDFTNTGLRAIIATSLPTKDDNTITYRTVKKVPAGTAIFIQASTEAYTQDITVPIITDAAEIAEAEQQVKDNKLQGSTTDVLTLKPVTEEKVYAINKTSNTLKYIDPVAIPYLRSNVTYFPVPQTNGATQLEFRLVMEGSVDGTSAITSIPTEQTVTTYDLTGRLTLPTAKGITIQSGKKTLR